MAKARVKRSRIPLLLVAGVVWPFAVAAFVALVDVHLFPLEQGWPDYMIMPVMAVGLIPLARGFYLMTPRKWGRFARALVSLAATGCLGAILLILTAVFFVWLHMLIGGA